jgi:signal transduction histidine kinase
MLMATIGLQYFLNYRTQQQNNDLRQLQSRALVAGIAMGANSLTSDEDRIADIMDRSSQTFLDPETKALIRDIIIIDNQWRVTDSLNEDYLPRYESDADQNANVNSSFSGNGNASNSASNANARPSSNQPKASPSANSETPQKITYKNLSDLKDLPPLMEGRRLGDDLQHFPNARTEENKNQDDEAHAIPIETSQGRWYVMVLLRNDKSETARRAALPLVFTLGVLTASTLITFMLVWRFTRPIANLSNAARKVAEGDLTVRVPDYVRGDEMGRLAERFNEMTAQLEMKRELEAKLQQVEKSAVVGRLGSAIAHEIRNPLNYINLTLDHLRSKFAPDDTEKREQFQKLTSQLKAEVARINQQISDFLNYSRPAKADLQPTDVRKVVDDSLRIVEAQAAEKNIKIAVIERENVPAIQGDPEFLRSVFNNLFINALQSMDMSGGHLNIKIEPETNNGLVDIEVSDTGSGIAPENLEKIFEPYFSTKETGTGLGLAIVQKIVDIHHGTIDVESKEGKGTKFTVRLPKAGS